MVWNAISIKFIVIVVRSSASASARGGGRGNSRGKCGMQMAIALMASSVSLCRHYAALSASTREPSATGHIHAGQLPKALSLLTHTHTHAGTHRRALAQQAKQIGGYYCHYNVYYCYPFNTKWPLLTGAILTFKCRRHCSKLTVRGQTATRLAASQRAVREWGGGSSGPSQRATLTASD